ncbi:MAG: 3-deoxy-manno-octulosonate cytidylyltransferase [Ignavibacteria bacterium]
MNVICIIPARLQSTRLPGKLLMPLGDKSILHHVYSNCKKVSLFSDVIIATDSDDIVEHCALFGAKVIMTGDHHASGTDRVYEAYTKNQVIADLIVNVQADEPFLCSEHIESIIHSHIKNDVDVCTGVTFFKDSDEMLSSGSVKVVTDQHDIAMYFSRSPIPFFRDELEFNLKAYKKHIGIYSYKEHTLKYFTELKESNYESIEKLEQLRLMEKGKRFLCVPIEYDGFGIDTMHDYQRALQRIQA